MASGKPVVGLTVKLRFATRVLHETTTASDGTFELPRPEGSNRTVEVLSDAWRVSPTRIRLDQAQSEGVSQLKFQAERLSTARVRGRVVDRATGEAVPGFLIRIRGPVGAKATARSEDALTDLDGRFESALGYEAGVLEFAMLDCKPQKSKPASSADVSKIEREHSLTEAAAGAQQTIELAVGPTYTLEFDLPEGEQLDDFYAVFPMRVLPELRDMHRSIAEDPNSGAALYYGGMLKPALLEPRAALRFGTTTWTRFASPIESSLQPQIDSREQMLYLRSLDGYWSGGAAVKSIQGIQQQPVAIELTKGGVIDVRIIDLEGRVVRSAWLQLSTAHAPSNVLAEVGVDPKGCGSFEWLEPAEYELRVECDRYEAVSVRATVEAGVNTKLEVRVQSASELGPVSGVLRGRTGRHRSKGAIIVLQSLENPELHLLKSLDYRKREGRYSAPFVFDDVPAGRYELSIRPLDNMQWDKLAMVVTAPAEDLEFICEDDVATFDFAFRALDAGTAAAIEQTWSIVWLADPASDRRLDDHWETHVYEGVPEGVPLQWVLRAHGYRLARGDETAFVLENKLRIAQVRLTRGWGQIFKVTNDEQQPIKGVELVVDGVSVGRSDARGLVSIDLDARPTKLEFLRESWHVSWGSIDPAEQNFGWGPETPVYLSPND